jgi:hypothetical protein
MALTSRKIASRLLPGSLADILKGLVAAAMMTLEQARGSGGSIPSLI